MDSSDLKKLITGFLILSAFSGSVTLILLNSADKSAPQSPLGQTVEGQNPLSIGKNAFVEQLPQNSFASASSQVAANQNLIQADSQTMDSTNSPQADSSNLTRNFANIFAKQVIDHNPDGPQLDENGKPTALNLPNEDAATQMISQALTNTNFTVDEKIPDEDVRVLTSYTPDDMKKYSDAMNSVLGNFVSGTTKIDAINQSSTDEIISLTGLSFETTYEKLKSISVPQPFAGMHRSVLQFFANQKKVFEIAGNYQADPLKTYIVLKNDRQIADRDLQRLQDENNKIKTLSFMGMGGGKNLSFLDTMLGVKKAYATGFPVIDASAIATAVGNFITTIMHWASEKADEIIKWAYTTALRIAVKILIDTFQNQVVNWIAGNGNPKFITDWKGFLTDVADKAAGQAISGLYPFLCSGIGPLIRIAVLPVPNLDTSVRCTLTQVIGNVTAFYNNFQNGGWIAYGAALQPQNNFFGGLIMVNDAAMRAAASAQEAAKNEAVASQGFLSIKKSTGKCLESRKEQGPSITVCNNIDETTGECVGNATHEEAAPIKDVCTKYEEINTTPGAAVGSTLTSALNWPQNQWVSAQRFEELVAAIVNAGINRMIRTGLSALTAASNPAPTNFANAIPLGVPNPGDISSLKSSLRSLVNTYQQNGTFQKFQDVSDADGQWLALKPQVVTTLNQVASGCPSLTSDAQQKITQLNSLQTNVTAEFLSASANTPDSFRTSIDSATSTQALNTILSRLQNLSSIPVDPTVAQARLTRLQNLQTSAQANLPNSCNVPLPNP